GIQSTDSDVGAVRPTKVVSATDFTGSDTSDYHLSINQEAFGYRLDCAHCVLIDISILSRGHDYVPTTLKPQGDETELFQESIASASGAIGRPPVVARRRRRSWAISRRSPR